MINNIEERLNAADDLDDGVLVAAIMDDSLGYASPDHAERHVDDFRDLRSDDGDHDGYAYCERAMSCFEADEYDDDDRAMLTGHPPGSTRKIIAAAVRHWQHMSDDKQAQVREFAEEWADVDDTAASMSVGLSYPVAGP